MILGLTESGLLKSYVFLALAGQRSDGEYLYAAAAVGNPATTTLENCSTGRFSDISR